VREEEEEEEEGIAAVFRLGRDNTENNGHACEVSRHKSPKTGDMSPGV
jgi:hypothetical protein